MYYSEGYMGRKVTDVIHNGHVGGGGSNVGGGTDDLSNGDRFNHTEII